VSTNDEVEIPEFLRPRTAELEEERAAQSKTTRARTTDSEVFFSLERPTRKEKLQAQEQSDLQRRAVRAAERTMWAAVFACVISVVALVVSLMVYIKPPAP
jgi:hypothetical protein